MSKGNVIYYKNSMYFPDDTVAVKLLTEKTKCLVIETFVGEIYIAIHNNIYKAMSCKCGIVSKLCYNKSKGEI